MARSKKELDNIELDSIRAMELGYGVHYGRFKADYPNTAVEIVVKDPKVRERKCKRCEAVFRPVRVDQVFCCMECREKWGAAHKGENKTKTKRWKREKYCRVCGKEITSPKQRVYCDWNCHKIAVHRKYLGIPLSGEVEVDG